MVVIIVDDREFNVDDTKTMLDAKEFIMKELELSCIYIDIEVCIRNVNILLLLYNTSCPFLIFSANFDP